MEGQEVYKGVKLKWRKTKTFSARMNGHPSREATVALAGKRKSASHAENQNVPRQSKRWGGARSDRTEREYLASRIKKMERLGWAPWNWQWQRAVARLEELKEELS